MTATVLITDPGDRLLIVRSTHGGTWHLPGGSVEQSESPLDAARREVREELGLDLDLRECDLFAVEWLQATRPESRDRLALVFAGPVLTPKDTAHVVLQSDEVDDWGWQTPETTLQLLHPTLAARIRGPLQTPGSTLYRETRTERTPPR
ncbi:NUDIX hydrolase [Streptomyces spectabilis]|uniref:NUDIX hydrolase n=1 Tax=Streptomyces spectabilis TaxID=68270 RepID=UPI0033D17A45